MTPCRDCPLNLDAAKTRVTLHRKPWSNSPAIWLGGPIADLMRLADAGCGYPHPLSAPDRATISPRPNAPPPKTTYMANPELYHA